MIYPALPVLYIFREKHAEESHGPFAWRKHAAWRLIWKREGNGEQQAASGVTPVKSSFSTTSVDKIQGNKKNLPGNLDNAKLESSGHLDRVEGIDGNE